MIQHADCACRIMQNHWPVPETAHDFLSFPETALLILSFPETALRILSFPETAPLVSRNGPLVYRNGPSRFQKRPLRLSFPETVLLFLSFQKRWVSFPETAVGGVSRNSACRFQKQCVSFPETAALCLWRFQKFIVQGAAPSYGVGTRREPSSLAVGRHMPS